LSFRSKDPVFKTDPGVIPDDETCKKAGITVVKTDFQHNDLSDRGPDRVKTSIQAMVDQFLDDDDSLKPGATTTTQTPPNPLGLITALAPP
jgi:hypothetical protein